MVTSSSDDHMKIEEGSGTKSNCSRENLPPRRMLAGNALKLSVRFDLRGRIEVPLDTRKSFTTT